MRDTPNLLTLAVPDAELTSRVTQLSDEAADFTASGRVDAALDRRIRAYSALRDAQPPGSRFNKSDTLVLMAEAELQVGALDEVVRCLLLAYIEDVLTCRVSGATPDAAFNMEPARLLRDAFSISGGALAGAISSVVAFYDRGGPVQDPEAILAAEGMDWMFTQDEARADPFGRRFLIVEGASDEAAVHVWARTLGFDLTREEVVVIPADGSGRVLWCLTLLGRLGITTGIFVLLDTEPEADRIGDAVVRQTHDRVSVASLGIAELEQAFPAHRVYDWLVDEGADLDGARGATATVMTKGDLRKAAFDLLERPYRPADDARLISGRMTEAEIPEAVKSLVAAIEAWQPPIVAAPHTSSGR